MKKEFMKRVMAAGMVAAMALTTVACGGSTDNSASTDKAGICQCNGKNKNCRAR